MSTENLPKKPSTTSHLKKLKTGDTPPKAAPSENVVEQVPPWLKQLLTKYGEREGRLVGLGEGYSPAETVFEAEEVDSTGLSALLDQMAEEGPSQASLTRSSTSVEWGGYQTKAEPESPAIDDLLSNLGTKPAAYNQAPDWLTDMQPEAYQPEPEYPHPSAAAPEWLNDMIGQEADVSPPPSGGPGSQDVPDWLTDALDSSPKLSTPPASSRVTPTTPPQPGKHDFDVPDWLNEALDTPRRDPAATTSPTPGSEIPDWLANQSVEPAESYQSPAADYPAAIEVPDWLESIASAPSGSQTPLDQDENETAIEVPDWLTSIAPSATAQTEMPQDWQISDWMTEDRAEQAESGGSADGEAEQGLPSLDWLFQGEESTPQSISANEPATTGSDWMFNLPGELTADPSAASSDMPDWLAQLPGTEQESGEVPDWFKDVSLPPVESDTEDWLADLNLSPDEPGLSAQSLAAMDLASEDILPAEQKPPVPEPDETKSLSRYKRLKPIESSTPPGQPAQEPADWTASKPPATPETSAPPQWRQDLPSPDSTPVESTFSTAPEEIPASTPQVETAEPSDWLSAFAVNTDLTPDWLADSPEPTPADWLSPEDALEEDDLLSKRLGWFTQNDTEKMVSEPAEPSVRLPEDSGWLEETPTPTLPEAAEPVSFNITPAASQPDDLDWLRDLPAPTSQEDIAAASVEFVPDQSEMDIPAWLADLPDQSASETSLETPGEEIEFPAWLTESSPNLTKQPQPEEEVEADIPSWLMNLSASETETSTWPTETEFTPAEETPADLASPGWLTDLSPAPEAASQEEGEAPDWLTELPAPDSASLPWLPQPADEIAGTTQANLETPPWQANLASEAEVEIPSWLTELSSDTSATPDWSASIDQTASAQTEVPEEILPWLTETTENPIGETPDENIDIPDWLSSLSPTEIEPEPETEAPSWFTALPAAEEQPPSWLASASETPLGETFSIEADEAEPLEIPDWLTALSADTPTPKDSEPEDETPPWLTELTSDTASADEPLAWLTEPGTEPETEADFDTPTWLSDLASEEVMPSLAAELPETETDVPDWLNELPESAAVLSTPAEELDEVPDWLNNLSEISIPEPSTETEPATLPASEKEPESPSWLNELPPIAEETPPWLAEPGDVPAAASEPEFEIPDWLTASPETVSAPEPVAWTDELSAPLASEPIPQEVQPELPDWLAELPQPSAAEAVPAVITVEEPVVPHLAAEPSEIPASQAAAADADEDELETPTWLWDLPPEKRDLIEDDLSEVLPAIAPAAEVEPSFWQPEPALSDHLPAETEAQAPSPLAEIPATPAESDLAEPPTWLAELPETATITEPEAMTSEAEQLPPETGPQDELSLEIPAWLSQLPPAPSAAAQAEPEMETPAWLTELTQESAAEEPVSPPTSETEEELVIPDWLGKSSTIYPPVVDEALETPGWLTELVETSPSEVESPQAETEPEIPAWLSELPQAPEEQTPPEESAVPDWLAELSETAEAAEPAADMPDWLADLRAAQSTALEVEPERPDEAEPAAPEMTAVSEFEPTQELPDRLAELSPEAAPVTEPAEELVIPSWLGHSAEVEPTTEPPLETPTSEEPAEDLVIPAWLNLPPETVTDSAPTAKAEAEEDLVFPAWLNKSPSATEPEEIQVEAASPSWLTELSETSPAQEEEQGLPAWLTKLPEAAEEETEAEPETPPWLAGLSATEQVEVPAWLTESEAEAISSGLLETTEPETVEGTPAWLSDLSGPAEDETPAWLSELQPTEAEADVTTAPAEAVETAAPLLEVQADDMSARPDWMLGLESAPEWPKGDQPEAEVGADNFLAFEEEPEAPDWLKDEPTTPLPSATSGRPKTGPLQLPGEAKPSSSVERMSEWLRNLQPVETPLEGAESEPRETTGMLTGLAPLLPAEKIGPATPTLAATTAESDAVQEAAQHFYTVATQAPQPAALPELPAKREGLLRRWLRALFHLVFIALIALPLIPGLQKTVNGQNIPWTEPAGELSDVLERQRRELTSAQLGVIDLQQPGSVALVSLDYSPATQGEMEPLAEAIIARLRGQGMRLIFVSLEPEGAALAQRTLDRILAERNEVYGVDVVNLGYIPGQVAGIREVVSGRHSLAGMADFNNSLTFAAAERANWNSINNLGQIDVVITMADNPATARWWIEQMTTAIPPDDGERYLLAATSALADPMIRPYLTSGQLNGLLSGLNGAAAIEAGRRNVGPARRMLDSQSVAHLTMVILIAAGTMAGWMPDQKDQA